MSKASPIHTTTILRRARDVSKVLGCNGMGIDLAYLTFHALHPVLSSSAKIWCLVDDQVVQIAESVEHCDIDVEVWRIPDMPPGYLNGFKRLSAILGIVT